ncbi:simple sugar transport system permease protein [Hydrogenoanaerobacterium saccharovorans]|uniref:Simple sugar transport system permease protein n=1 Tax=Hydrogenoanaerobacterium saccharovorans TaxID=474960 RepID=A0A1H8D5C0_9FIRM|nr:ABC transporter permease [Hydrogenoanaerobacterium saccharovorans]RPF43504.1 simple sugar transport system permease protein [Hydrogenoanaerobacterium saccharovorans]SEN02531.1 simple sugar transport system permease protein [Hydrogenoanaerobacterium saccharovorans]
MNIDFEYIAVVINSTIRMMTPVLYAALGSAICSKVWVFNIALEGQMLTGAFMAIVINYYTGSVLLSVLGAALSGMLVALIVGILQVKFRASDMVVGTSINLLMLGATTFLLYVIFGVKGVFTDPRLKGLPKIELPIIKDIPFIGTMFARLTFLDYFAIIMAVLLYIYLFKTVSGFRLQAVGINKQAVNSLGINADRTQICAVVFSGLLCGLGGVLLTLGQVTLYTENVTAGRGFFAMAAANLGGSHPIGVVISSFFFGFAEAIGNALQGTAIKSQLTMALPYIVTIIALVFSSNKFRKRARVLK